MSEPQDEQTPKSPVEEAVEHAVDLFVYAPIGLLFEGASLVPQLVEKGKAQVAMARMLGQFAVTQGRSEATKVAEKAGMQALGLLARFGQSPNAHPPVVPEADAPAPEAPEEPPAATPYPPARAADPAAGEPAANGAAERIDPATLAIPDYDGLSASHVVNRLAGLSPEELEAVRRYEAANRGRKTILSKVAQLQAG